MRFGLEESAIAKICEVFAKYANIKEVRIYGSRVKGNYKNGSDIDLTIYSTKPDTNELTKIKIEIDELMLPYGVDLNAYDSIKNEALREHIDRVGKIFYQG